MDDNDKLSILFKKYQGYVNTSTNAAVGVEYPVLANPNLLTKYFYAQSIPVIPPSGPNLRQVSPTPPNMVAKYIGTGQNRHIAYYQKVSLIISQQSSSAYYYSSDRNANILTHVISPNYNPNGLYNISVYDNDILLSTNDYNFDRDAGVITVYRSVSNLNVSFWRYEGVFGIGATGPTGEIGYTGVTGPQGTTGPSGWTGPEGMTGLQGLTGVTGPQGAQGSQGPLGPQGSQGPQGPARSTGLRRPSRSTGLSRI